MAKQVLAASGIPQARHRAFADHERTPGLPNELAADLGLPCFVKPANMGSSVGVSKARTVEELRGPGKKVVKEVIERPTLADLFREAIG